MPRNWTHAAGIIWPLLIKAGSAREILSYTDLSVPIKTNPLSVGKALGPIQDFCLEQKLAPLTAIVVSKTSGVPGAGFVAWDVDDLDSARNAVQQQNWSLVGNPFAGFGPDEDEDTLSSKILEGKEAQVDVYSRIKNRGVLQRIFRKSLIKAYEKCAICGITFIDALEAAHIVPWGECLNYERIDVTNGMLLCANHHKLFDADIFQIGEDLNLIYYDPDQNDGDYSATDLSLTISFHGKQIFLPSDKSLKPSSAYIARRAQLKDD